MSGTGRPLAAPPPPARRSWFTPRRIVASAALGVGCVAIVVMLAFRPHKPPPEPPRPPVRAAGATYEPPAPVVHAVARAAAPPQPSPPSFVTQAPPPMPTSPTMPQAAATAPPKRPAVYSFSSGANSLPEYMKPKVAEANSGKAGATNIMDTFPKTATIADQTMILSMDPFICSLDTAINTDVPGPFMCHLPFAVLSATGVTLMDQGTKVWGHYNSNVTQGQKRIVSVTAKAKTPNGVVIPLTGGSMADELGASGVPGNVDNHWGERLGPALMLSLLDGGFALAQTELQKAGSTNLNISTGSGVGSLAQEILHHSINIPPTITLPQGTLVALWPPDFINFNPSYRLEMAR